MKLSKLNTAIAEAERFLDRARAAQSAHNERTSLEILDLMTHLNASHPRENGALRRSSMDLTRALADLRRPE